MIEQPTGWSDIVLRISHDGFDSRGREQCRFVLVDLISGATCDCGHREPTALQIERFALQDV